MKPKVLLDANVLISASIAYTSKELKCEIKHHFHDYAIPLLKFFKNNPDKQIGLSTRGIEQCANEQLSNAILSCIKGMHSGNKEHLYQTYSVILAESQRNLQEVCSYLSCQPVNRDEIARLNLEILPFYFRLRHIAEKNSPIEAAKKKRSGIPRRYRGITELWHAPKDELYTYGKVRDKLQSSSLSLNDMELLATAMYLKGVLSKETKVGMYLSSTDHHFSPIRKGSGDFADFIPSRIEKEFGIVCDWPDKILATIKKYFSS